MKGAAMPAHKQPDMQKRRTGLAVVFALASLILIAGASYVVWQQMGQIDLGVHGWIALIAGSVGMVVLGGGLMALAFIPRAQAMMRRPGRNVMRIRTARPDPIFPSVCFLFFPDFRYVQKTSYV